MRLLKEKSWQCQPARDLVPLSRLRESTTAVGSLDLNEKHGGPQKTRGLGRLLLDKDLDQIGWAEVHVANSVTQKHGLLPTDG